MLLRLWFRAGMCLLSVVLIAQQQPSKASVDTRGTLSSKYDYSNPALGMSFLLPDAAWQFFTEEEQRRIGVQTESAPDPHCQGPLCGEAPVKVSLITRLGQTPGGHISLLAYKVSPPYLDRTRYPLKLFAQGMTKGSMGNTSWIADGDLISIQLDGRPAYRLLVHKPTLGFTSKGFAYVGEANGYVFMVLAVAVNVPPSEEFVQKLQTAMENMKLNPNPTGAR